MTSIKSILKAEPEKMVMIQVRITEKLASELKPFMKKNDFRWSDVVRASLTHLRDEIMADKKK